MRNKGELETYFDNKSNNKNTPVNFEERDSELFYSEEYVDKVRKDLAKKHGIPYGTS